MLNVRFVEGTAEDFSITYDTEWPVVPRLGEFVSITDTGQVMDWEVTRVAYIVGGDEKLIRALVWIEPAQVQPSRQTYQAMGFDVS